MILEIILGIVCIAFGITLFFLWKLIKKIEFYEQWIGEFKRKVNYVYNGITEIDTIGAFEADDETGFIFTEMKNLVEELNGYVTVDEEIWIQKK